MWIIAFLQESLKGRGIYPITLVIVSWSYLIVILVYLIYEVFLCAFKVRYEDESFKKGDSKKK